MTDGCQAARRADVQAKRDEAVRKATASTPLAAAGLSPRALSIAQQHLGVSTVGELAHIPARRITMLRGIGSRPRYELVRRSREWRLRLRLAETDDPGAGKIQFLPNGPSLCPGTRLSSAPDDAGSRNLARLTSSSAPQRRRASSPG